MTKQEIDLVLEKHLKWLRSEDGGERANLSEASLSMANLSRADLSVANLSGANLSRADLSGADLSWANLSWANLYMANLSRANLSRADLSRADLSWADLSWANLKDTLLDGRSILSFQFEKHGAYFYGSDEIVIGCERKTVSEWLDQYDKIGKANNYSEEQIKKYKMFIDICSRLLNEK